MKLFLNLINSFKFYVSVNVWKKKEFSCMESTLIIAVIKINAKSCYHQRGGMIPLFFVEIKSVQNKKYNEHRTII